MARHQNILGRVNQFNRPSCKLISESLVLSDSHEAWEKRQPLSQ